mgnify:CR=1 FL=1
MFTLIMIIFKNGYALKYSTAIPVQSLYLTILTILEMRKLMSHVDHIYGS